MKILACLLPLFLLGCAEQPIPRAKPVDTAPISAAVDEVGKRSRVVDQGLDKVQAANARALTKSEQLTVAMERVVAYASADKASAAAAASWRKLHKEVVYELELTKTEVLFTLEAKRQERLAVKGLIDVRDALVLAAIEQAKQVATMDKGLNKAEAKIRKHAAELKAENDKTWFWRKWSAWTTGIILLFILLFIFRSAIAIGLGRARAAIPF